MNRPSAQDYKVLSKTPSEICSLALLCKIPLSQTKDRNTVWMCPVPVCCLGRPVVSQCDWSERDGTPLSLLQGIRYEIKTPKTRSVAHCLLPSHVYSILRCTKSTLIMKTAPHFVQYLISYITALLALTQQPQQYRRSTFPESANHIPLSVSHEVGLRVTKTECEKKQKHCGVFIISWLRSP